MKKCGFSELFSRCHFRVVQLHPVGWDFDDNEFISETWRRCGGGGLWSSSDGILEMLFEDV